MADKEGPLPFKLVEEESGEALTSFGGLPLVIETCEALGLAGLVNRHVRIKQRDRGYSESTYVHTSPDRISKSPRNPASSCF